MALESNAQLLQRLLGKGLGENDGETIDELVAPGYVNRDAPLPVRGPEGFKHLAAMYRSAFPDLTVVVEDTFSDRDLVGTRGRITGTHRGDFMGVAATGRSIDVKYIDLWRVEDGQFTDTWVEMDVFGLMGQLGALPAPANA